MQCKKNPNGCQSHERNFNGSSHCSDVYKLGNQYFLIYYFSGVGMYRQIRYTITVDVFLPIHCTTYVEFPNPLIVMDNIRLTIYQEYI